MKRLVPLAAHRRIGRRPIRTLYTVAIIALAGNALASQPSFAGGAVASITSADGAWTAGIDAKGQVTSLVGPLGLDHVFESLVYVAVDTSGFMSQRMEFVWQVTEQTFLPRQAITVLERPDSLISLRIHVLMHGGPHGGAEVRLTATNIGVGWDSVKIFYYVDFEVAATAGDDQVVEVFGIGGEMQALTHIDEEAAGGPSWFRNIGAHESYQVTYFPALRTALDVGVNQLSGVDETNVNNYGDHTVALTDEAAFLTAGESKLLQVGLGGSQVGLTCPWDCSATPDVHVGTADLLTLLSAWGSYGTCDFDGFGVGTSDLLTLIQNWGGCP